MFWRFLRLWTKNNNVVHCLAVNTLVGCRHGRLICCEHLLILLLTNQKCRSRVLRLSPWRSYSLDFQNCHTFYCLGDWESIGVEKVWSGHLAWEKVKSSFCRKCRSEVVDILVKKWVCWTGECDGIRINIAASSNNRGQARTPAWNWKCLEK